MLHQTLYRKYRPQDFSSLVGQPHIQTALSNALSSGKISHAYLFAGPRGTGKTSTARILAKSLNCEQGPTAQPCNHCSACELITQGASMDVVEIDAASNRGIDQIRDLREKVGFAPVGGKYKVYIIDEVHMLTTEAFNGFLKVLEEPPAHAVFILATTEPQKIPATIHSRCQRYDFHRVTVEAIVGRLESVVAAEELTATAGALRLIAIQAEGGLRDALSLLEQCSVMAEQIDEKTVRQVLGLVGREGVRRLMTSLGEHKLAEALASMNELYQEGKEVKQILVELAEYYRALLLFQTAAGYEDIYLTDTKESLAALAPLFGPERILAATARLHQALEDMRFSVRSKLYAELCLVDLCRVQGDSVRELAARVEQLEQQLAGGASVPPPAQAVVAKPQPVADPSLPEEPPELEEGTAVLGLEPEAAPAQPATQPATQPAAQPAAQPATQSAPKQETPVADKELRAIWLKVIEAITAARKRTLAAYARNAYPLSHENKRFLVGVETAMGEQRMNKIEYKQLFETELSKLYGEPTTFVCQMATRPVLKEEDLSPVVKTAMAVFGGTAKEQ